jgi:hypothetical protein
VSAEIQQAVTTNAKRKETSRIQGHAVDEDGRLIGGLSRNAVVAAELSDYH